MAGYIPQHQLSEAGNTRRIDIHSWSIEATTAPIINASESDALQATLGFPLPEMTFANSLVLEHKPSGWQYRFDTENALKRVKGGELQDGDGGVKVGYADAWLKSRFNSLDPDSSIPLPETSPSKPYDWTYTCVYPGHLASQKHSFTAADPQDKSHVIPIAELTRQDPILFYAEIPLYEDELHDNGASQVTVRVRVMPKSFFLLSRFTLRVDNVLFRTYDTRIYHSFSSPLPLVVRETSGWEAPYDDVKLKLPSKNDLTPLTDPNFIAQALGNLPPAVSQKSGAGTGWRELGTQLQVSVI